MEWLAVKKVLAALVLPPAGPLLVALAGLALLGRSPRWGRVLAWLGVLSLAALSLPVVSHALVRSLYHGPALDFAQARDAQAVVILGGGIRRDAPEYGGDTLGRLTLERVRYGAWVSRRTRLPVLASSGVVHSGTPEGELMKRVLEEEFGIEVRWAETRSRETRSNARASAAILLPLGLSRVLLVSHGFDMPRAAAEFAAAGLRVIAAPTAIAHERLSIDHPIELLPGMNALHGSYHALYELLAGAARRLSD